MLRQRRSPRPLLRLRTGLKAQRAVTTSSFGRRVPVRFDRMTTLMTLIVIACLSGCGVIGTTTVTSTTVIHNQERNFAGALEFLNTGNEQGAKELFERVVVAKPIKGITDE